MNIIASLLLACLCTTSDLEAGFAATDLTPPVGFRKGGGFGELVSTGVHDRLYAKTMILRQGDTVCVLTICDLLSVIEPMTTPLRKRIEKEMGVPFAHVVITATHTHGGPEYHGPLRNHYHEKAKKANGGQDPRESVNFIDWASGRILDSVVEAKKRLKPVKLEVMKTRKDGLAFNRRYYMDDAVVKFNPGKRNPKVERPAGPADPDLHFLLFKNLDDRPIAGLSTFAMHVATFGGTEIGADYPASLAKTLQNQFGPDFFSLFGQGAAGDINHVNVMSPQPDPPTEKIGQILGETLVQALPNLKPVQTPSLAIKSATVSWPLLEVTKEDVERAQEVMDRTDRKPVDFLLHVDAWRILHNHEFRQRFGDKMPNEIQVFRISADTAIVNLPHEIFVELGISIKQRSPFANTLVISMAHDVDFYIPTLKGYAQGGYEVHTTPFKPGVGEALVEAAVELLQALGKK